MIGTYEEIENGGQEKEAEGKDRQIYLPVREPGSGLWPEVLKAVQGYKKKQELQKKLKDDTLPPE